MHVSPRGTQSSFRHQQPKGTESLGLGHLARVRLCGAATFCSVAGAAPVFLQDCFPHYSGEPHGRDHLLVGGCHTEVFLKCVYMISVFVIHALSTLPPPPPHLPTIPPALFTVRLFVLPGCWVCGETAT